MELQDAQHCFTAENIGLTTNNTESLIKTGHKNASPNIIEVEDSPVVSKCVTEGKVDEDLIKVNESEAGSKASVECICTDSSTVPTTKKLSEVLIASPISKRTEDGTHFDFSPEVHLGLMSTQMNKQIERVEKFLRTDRLRRKRDPLDSKFD